MGKKYYEYIHSNKRNSKKDIGQTCQQTKTKWNNFIYRIGENILTLNKINQLDFYLIKKYNNCGYNLKDVLSYKIRKKMNKYRKDKKIFLMMEKRIGFKHLYSKPIIYIDTKKAGDKLNVLSNFIRAAARHERRFLIEKEIELCQV